MPPSGKEHAVKRMVPVLVVLSMTLVACKNEQAAAPPAAPPPAQTAAPAAAPPASAAPAAPAAVVAPTVADLPDYPGATRVSLRSEPHAGFARSVEAKFNSGDTFDNVKKFYVAAIASNGWQVTGTKEKPGEVKWYLAKGTSTGAVEVENEHGALQIKLERNDK
jgi:hypothetical protein